MLGPPPCWDDSANSPLGICSGHHRMLLRVLCQCLMSGQLSASKPPLVRHCTAPRSRLHFGKMPLGDQKMPVVTPSPRAELIYDLLLFMRSFSDSSLGFVPGFGTLNLKQRSLTLNLFGMTASKPMESTRLVVHGSPAAKVGLKAAGHRILGYC